MESNAPYISKIRAYETFEGLNGLWDEIKAKRELQGWPNGRAFEYLILRAFELEGAIVEWPYRVYLQNVEVEQIDGMVHLPSENIRLMVETKDWETNVPIVPIAKLRNQLLRRPSQLIGSIFTSSSFTDPAIILSGYLSQNTILLWDASDVDFCFQNQYFRKAAVHKYEETLKYGISTGPLKKMENYKI
jgi:Restriction endonuclease